MTLKPHAVCRKVRQALTKYDAWFADATMTRAQYAVLDALARAEVEPVTQHSILAETGFDTSTLSEIVIRLERRGFLSRGPSLQRRAIQRPLYLTDAGREAYLLARPLALKADRELRAALKEIGRRK